MPYTITDDVTGNEFEFEDSFPIDKARGVILSKRPGAAESASFSIEGPATAPLNIPPPTEEEVASALPAVGATIGGFAGGGAASIPFAAVGGAAGKAAEEIMLGKPLSARDIATEGAIQGGMQAVGLGVGKVIGKVAAPLARKVAPKAQEAIDFFKSYGGRMSPAQATESKIMDTVEEIAEGSLTGRETMMRFRKGQTETIGRIVDDMSSNIGTKLSPEEAGRVALDAIEGNLESFNRVAKTMYGQVDELAKGASVDLSAVKEFASEQMKIAAARKGIGASQAGDSLLSKVTELPDTVTFKQAQSIRSGLWDELHAAQATRDKAAGLAKKFLGLTDDAMEKGAKNLGNEAYEAWRGANSFYKTNKEIFKAKLIARLSKDNPEIVVEQIFKPGRISNVQQVRKALSGTPEAWDTLRGAYFNKILSQSSDESGELVGKKLAVNLKRIGDPMLREVFGGSAKNLSLLAKASSMAQSTPGGSGGMLIQLTQAGAFGALVSLQYPKAGLSVLLGPYAAAKIITSDAGINWLTKGVSTPANTQQAVAILGRILREAGRANDVKVNFPMSEPPKTPLVDQYLR